MTAQRPLPDLYAEQQALGQLPRDVDSDLHELLSSQAERSQRLAEIEQSNQSILDQYPVEQFAALINARLSTAKHEARPAMGLHLAAVGLALALLAVMATWWFSSPAAIDPRQPDHDPTQDVIRHKGDPRLEVHQQEGLSSRPLVTGDQVAQGMLLQLRYFAGDRRYGMIFSLDGRGDLTLHFPNTADGSTLLQLDRAIALPFAYELDDAPGFERFFFVSSREPLHVRMVLDTVRNQSPKANGPLHLPAGLRTRDLLLNKTAAP